MVILNTFFKVCFGSFLGTVPVPPAKYAPGAFKTSNPRWRSHLGFEHLIDPRDELVGTWLDYDGVKD